MKYVRTVSVLLALPLIAAQAQTLEQKNMIAQDKVEVAEHAAATNKTCGTHIAFSVDYPSFAGIKTDPDNANQQSPYAYFANVTDALDQVCGTPAGKASVQAKIKSVVVSHAKSESESLQGGTFHYNVPYAGASYPTIIAWLNKNL